MEKKNNKPSVDDIIDKIIKKKEEKARLKDEKDSLIEEEIVEEIVVPIEEIKVATEQELFVVEAKSFLWSMLKSGRARMTQEEAKRLEEIYNRTLGLAEKVGNCDICGVRMFRRMCNIYGVK